MNRKAAIMVLAVAVAASCRVASAADKPAAVDPAYQQSFEKWKNELVEDLKQEWLPLAGLFWLKPGENSFGTDPKNAIVFPKGPAHAGSFTLQGKTVTVKFAPGTNAIIAGKPATRAELQPDTAGEPTVVELGNLRLHVIIRGERVGIRLKDLDSDAVRQFRGAQFFPLNLSYRVTANLSAFRRQADGRCSQRAGRCLPNPDCRDRSFQTQWPGVEAHRSGRRRREWPVLRLQRSHQQD